MSSVYVPDVTRLWLSPACLGNQGTLSLDGAA